MGEISPQTVNAIEQAMARARAADGTGDKAACEQALAQVRRTLGRWCGRADDSFSHLVGNGLLLNFFGAMNANFSAFIVKRYPFRVIRLP
jgi:hypothetical protein